MSTATGTSLPHRLDREWSAMRHRRAVLHRVAAWGLPVEVEMESLDDLLRAAGMATQRCAGNAAIDRTPGGTADQVLAGLVVVARHDAVAARVVLQRLLPGLCTRAKQWSGRCEHNWLHAFDELITAAWMVIRTYPVERRPTHVVAGLLRAVEQQAFVRGTRRVWHSEAVEPSRLDTPVDPADLPVEPLLELADLLAEVGPLLSEHDRTVLRRLAAGGTTHEVAAGLEVSVRTLANHREAAVQRVRAALAA